MERIHDMEPSQRPRERLLENHASVLSDAELVAILLRTGRPGHSAVATAHQLLAEAGGLVELSRMDVVELMQPPGMGPAKAAALAAALELGHRLASRELQDADDLSQPKLVGELLARRYQAERREVSGFFSLDQRNRLLRCHELSHGTRREAPVEPAELCRRAVLDQAAGVIFFHNHPSGELTASADDLRLTARLAAACELLGVPLLDHIIVAAARWLSLRMTRPDIFTTAHMS